MGFKCVLGHLNGVKCVPLSDLINAQQQLSQQKQQARIRRRKLLLLLRLSLLYSVAVDYIDDGLWGGQLCTKSDS